MNLNPMTYTPQQWDMLKAVFGVMALVLINFAGLGHESLVIANIFGVAITLIHAVKLYIRWNIANQVAIIPLEIVGDLTMLALLVVLWQ